MTMRFWIRELFNRSGDSTARKSRRGVRPAVEQLEDRLVPSTIIVNNATDTPVVGETDLRQAIAAANSTPGANTIIFDPTAFASAETITLGSGPLTLGNTTGTQTITGPAAGVTVSGGHSVQDFVVNAGVTAVFSDLSIVDGYASSGGGIYNHGTLTVSNSTLSGNTATVLLGGGGGIDNIGTLTLSNSTLSGNSAFNTGGGIYNNGSLTVGNSTLSGNSAGVGGGIANFSSLTVSNSTLSGNSAANGGGIYNSLGSATVSNSSLTGNSAGVGGGIATYTSLTVSNSTLSGNTASSQGGGIFNSGSLTMTNATIADNATDGSGGGVFTAGAVTSTLTNCTVSGNSASNSGGGLFNLGTTSLTNTIVAGNTAANGPDASGTFASQGNNLIGATDGSSGWVGSDLIGSIASPEYAQLAPLGNYGGPTETMALLPGSPAIAAGTTVGAPATDQRGLTRSNPPSIGAFEGAAYIVTNTSNDPSVSGSLPYEVNLANDDVTGGQVTIGFDPTVFAAPEVITLAATLELNNKSPGGVIDLEGPAAGVTVSGGNAVGVFEVIGGVTASITGLTITEGATADNGAGLDNSGTLTLTDCTISANTVTSTSGSGGGIYNNGVMVLSDSTVSNNAAGTIVYLGDYNGNNGGGLSNNGGTASLTDSTFSGNQGGGYGGAVFTFGGGLSVSDCTMVGNDAGISGGAIEAQGTVMAVTSSTLVGNQAEYGSGGGIDNYYNEYSVTVGDSILAGNSCYYYGPNFFNQVISAGNNLIGAANGSSGWLSSDLTGTSADPLNPLLATLGNYGGPTQTMALLPGSPAIDAGSNALILGGTPTDQRGFPRIVNGTVDIGAFESSGFVMAVTSGSGQSTNITEAFAAPLVVTVVANNPIEPVAGGQVTFTAPLSGPSAVLSAASVTIAADGTASVTATANVYAGGYAVTAAATGAAEPSFALTNLGSLIVNTNSDAAYTAPGVNTLRLAIAYGDVLGGNQTITFAANVTGAITLNGSRLVFAEPSAHLTVQGPGASVLSVSGGGLSEVFQVDSGVTASISGLTITDGAAVVGGGVANLGTLTLTNCTVSGNTAGNAGGLFNYDGTATLTDCTVSGNTAGADGGGILNSFGSINLTDCTVSGNSAVAGGGILNSFGTATLTDSTISGNSAVAGGGIETTVGTLTLVNCTISGNTANSGGGIFQYVSSVALTDCTISGNTANSGGGIYNESSSGTLTIGNTIVSGNTAATAPDIDGLISLDTGHNLFGAALSSSTFGSGDIFTNTPLLASLGNYGGPTQTMALLPGSPAIDAGGNPLIPVGVATDQRGLPRIVNNNVDIGAFESSGFSIALTSGNSQSVDVTETFANPLVVTVTANNPLEPVANGQVTFTVAPAANGAGANLASSPATINGSGQASVIATANATAGGYIVTAAATDGFYVVFQLTNTPPVTVTGLSPASGLVGGNTTVVITGTGFVGVTAVEFGGNNAINYTVNSTTQITATDPAGSGVVNVTVTTSSSVSPIVPADRFTYAAITSVTVNGDVAPIVDMASNGSGIVTVTTDGSHGFAPSTQTVVISGFTGANAGYDGTFLILSVPTSNTFTIYNATANLPALTNTNQGLAISQNTASGLQGVQRSMVDSVAYNFSAPVSLTAAEFTLGASTPTVSAPASAPVPATLVPGMALTSLAGGSIWVVTWISGGGTGAAVIGHSLADGVYNITLADSGRATDTFYRLYGNILGFNSTSQTASLNNQDSLTFTHSYLLSTGAALYLADADYDANGVINNLDSLNFTHRFLSVWSGFTPTI